MKFDSNYRGSQRSDYEQFARFLSGRQSARNDAGFGTDCGCESDCGCEHHTICNTRPIAMVYGVSQEWKNIYDIELGLSNGTVFEELNLPLERTGCSGGRGCRG